MESAMKQPVSEERIRQRAYALWEEQGRPEGREAEHWDEARRQIEEEEEEGSESEAANRVDDTDYPGLQADIAEGDRQRVERELVRQQKTTPKRRGKSAAT